MFCSVIGLNPVQHVKSIRRYLLHRNKYSYVFHQTKHITVRCFGTLSTRWYHSFTCWRISLGLSISFASNILILVQLAVNSWLLRHAATMLSADVLVWMEMLMAADFISLFPVLSLNNAFCTTTLERLHVLTGPIRFTH